MADDYYIELDKYSLNQFKEQLKKAKLIPSRKILKEQIDERFNILSNKGIQNLDELLILLKTPKKVKELSEKSGIPYDYLLILRREINSYRPKPVKLDKFPGIEMETINKLNKLGIKNTAHLFKRIKTEKDRIDLARETDINNEKIIELTKLTDLTRIKWIGPVFARIFYDSGVDTAQKVSDADSNSLYKMLVQINEEKGYTRSKFIESDAEMCIDVSKMVPKVIKY